MDQLIEDQLIDSELERRRCARALQAINDHMAEIDTAIFDADRAHLPMRDAGFVLVDLDAPMATALLSALSLKRPACLRVTDKSKGQFLGIALRRVDIEVTAAIALGVLAPHLVDTIKRAPRTSDGLGCFVFSTEGVIFAPIARRSDCSNVGQA